VDYYICQTVLVRHSKSSDFRPEYKLISLFTIRQLPWWLKYNLFPLMFFKDSPLSICRLQMAWVGKVLEVLTQLDPVIPILVGDKWHVMV